MAVWLTILHRPQYWSSVYDPKTYMLDPPYPQLNGRRGACHIEGRFGMVKTYEWLAAAQPRTLTLCPRNFNVGGTLGSASPSPVSYEEFLDQQRAGRLGDVPTVAGLNDKAYTVYHELFHLVLGGAATSFSNDPAYNEEYNPAKILGSLSAAQTQRNAHSYVLAALTWWYTKRDLDNGNDPPVEFWTTYQTRGKSSKPGTSA